MESPSVDHIWAADLVDMKAFSKFNDGYKYLLMVIDTYSRYGWIKALKDKTAKSVAEAFSELYKKGRKPEKIWVDNGKEIYNSEVKKLGVLLYSTNNEEKYVVVERWNRTIKERMFKYFTANSTYKYVDILEDLVKDYNNTVHSALGITPAQASTGVDGIFNAKTQQDSFSGKPKFEVGDRVRIAKKKGTFEKGYTPRWTEEVITISEIKRTNPITYKIKDYNNELIEGSFYAQELQKTEQEVYRIEKVIKKKGNMSLVKWKGYPDSFHSWVNNSDLINLKQS